MMLKKITCFLLLAMGLSTRLEDQQSEMRRQYADYLRLFKKQEKPNSYEMFLENLSRISSRECQRYVNRDTDEILTFIECELKD